MAWLPGGARHSWAFLGRSWVGTPPYQIAKDRQGATCRRASPRAPARSLLVVTGHRLETPTRGAVATPGLDIGRCNDDMGVREVASRVDRWSPDHRIVSAECSTRCIGRRCSATKR